MHSHHLLSLLFTLTRAVPQPQSSVGLWESCTSTAQCPPSDANWPIVCCVGQLDVLSNKSTCRPQKGYCATSTNPNTPPANAQPPAQAISKVIATPFDSNKPVNDQPVQAPPPQKPQTTQGYSDINAYLKAGVSRIQFPNTGDFVRDSLDTHNLLRQLMGRQLLTWDTALANQAQSYAQFLASTNKFEHSHKTLQPYGFLGENLYRETNGDPSPRAAILAWFNEFPLYPTGTPIGQGNFEGYGHFTEMQFATVRRVGCGHVLYNGGATNVYVCNYDVCQGTGQVLDMSVPAVRPFGL